MAVLKFYSEASCEYATTVPGQWERLSNLHARLCSLGFGVSLTTTHKSSSLVTYVLQVTLTPGVLGTISLALGGNARAQLVMSAKAQTMPWAMICTINEQVQIIGAQVSNVLCSDMIYIPCLKEG